MGYCLLHQTQSGFDEKRAKHWQGPNVADELGTFVYLFEEQLEIINQQIKDLQEADKKRKAVKWYCANYKVSLGNLKAREDGKE